VWGRAPRPSKPSEARQGFRRHRKRPDFFATLALKTESETASPAEVPVSKVNIAEKFAKIAEYWRPYIAAELNGQCVKLDKLKGEFVFHQHENEDEMFLVVKGRFRMEFRDRQEWIEEGEFIVVPRGIEHRPVADEECWILLFEPATTLNTGNVENERTLHELERV
jgi:mannose-6-phosphate isomerase-like protein (cupin superfamily)